MYMQVNKYAHKMYKYEYVYIYIYIGLPKEKIQNYYISGAHYTNGLPHYPPESAATAMQRLRAVGPQSAAHQQAQLASRSAQC